MMIYIASQCVCHSMRVVQMHFVPGYTSCIHYIIVVGIPYKAKTLFCTEEWHFGGETGKETGSYLQA